MRETCFISAAHRARLIRALDFFFIMNLERRKQLIIKWSPLLLICFLVMAALSFWHKPLSLSQTAFLLAIGLLYGGFIVVRIIECSKFMSAAKSNNSFNRSADWMAFIYLESIAACIYSPRPVNSGVRFSRRDLSSVIKTLKLRRVHT